MDKKFKLFMFHFLNLVIWYGFYMNFIFMGSIDQQAEIVNQSIVNKTYFEHVFKSLKHQPNVLNLYTLSYVATIYVLHL
jgi:hypothetical protein